MKRLKNKAITWKKAGVFLTNILIVFSLILSSIGTVSSDSVDASNYDSEIKTLTDNLLEEGFEEGTMPPTGWTVIDGHETKNWMIVDENDPNIQPHSGDYAAAVKRDHVNPQDEHLISPELDLDNYESVELHFWAHCWTLMDGATVKVIVNEEVIWDMIEDEDWDELPAEWREVVLDLTSFIETTIDITWQYVGIGGWDFGLDDILVIGEPFAPPPELEIGRIIGGGKLLSGGEVSAEIINVGEGDSSAVNYTFIVTGGIFRLINITDKGATGGLAAGEQRTIPCSQKSYGLGKINITIIVDTLEIEPVNKSVDGLILFFYIIIP
jgi:hypothetical protein